LYIARYSMRTAFLHRLRQCDKAFRLKLTDLANAFFVYYCVQNIGGEQSDVFSFVCVQLLLGRAT